MIQYDSNTDDIWKENEFEIETINTNDFDD
jgi:hypothetical protein